MMQRIFGIWIGVIVLLFPLVAVAQLPSFLLRAGNEEMCLGGSGSTSVLVIHVLPLAAFSFGLQHEEWLEVTEIDQGTAVAAINGGLGPDFWYAVTTDNGAPAGYGGLVILMIASDFSGVIDPIQPDPSFHEIAHIDFSAPTAVPGEGTSLDFVGNLVPVGGSPSLPVPVVLVAEDGSEYYPQAGVVVIPGSVTVKLSTQEPVEDLECEKESDRHLVEVEWELEEEELYSSIEIYVDDVFYTELDPETEEIYIPFDPFLGWHTIGVLAINACGDPTSMVTCDILLTEHYQRGDVTGDGSFGLEDPIHFINWAFGNYPDITCYDAADADDDGVLNLVDPVYMLLYLFAQGPPLQPPTIECGLDPTPDGLVCESFVLCP